MYLATDKQNIFVESEAAFKNPNFVDWLRNRKPYFAANSNFRSSSEKQKTSIKYKSL